ITYPYELPGGSSATNSLATLTHPTPAVWELELHNGVDNRFTRDMISSCLDALDQVEKDWRSTPNAPGALIIVGSKKQEKFFSNGLDYENAIKDATFVWTAHDPWLKRLLGFPIPIICAMNGHTFAFGFITALACDYRIMTTGRAWASMNEVFFGAALAASVNAIMNYKLPPKTVRKTILEGHRWTAQELLAAGIIDEVAQGTAGVVKAAHDMAQQKADLAKSGAFGLIKKELARKVIEAVERSDRPIKV
ncbi:ClpP/crotonase, partial [Clavulina sp. PMI_390]